MLSRLFRSALLVYACLTPLSAVAGVAFTEIMYDVPGADSGREWIEIQNPGSSAVDLAGWKLFENDVNHRLNAVGASAIPPGGFAVIVSNVEKFSADWPQFQGLLFKSSFSLSNTGEPLSLKEADLKEVIRTEYGASVAVGDGNSLNWVGDAWVARQPTPGGAASSQAIAPPQKTTSSKRNPAASSEVYTGDGASDARAVSNTAGAFFSEDSDAGIVPWVVALIAVIAIAGVAIFLGHSPRPRSGYTIIEEDV